MRIAILVSVVCLAVMCCASAAMAAVDGPYLSNTVGFKVTDWVGDQLLLPKFNPSLGILNQVDIIINGAMKTTLTVENKGAANSTGRTYTNMKLTVKDAGNLINLQAVLNSDEFYFTDLAPLATISSPELTATGTAFGSFSNADILSAVTGSGNFSLLATTLTEAWIGYNGGNANATQVTTAQASARVTYYYTTVPEPSSLLALFTGVIGVIGFVRRKK